MQKLKAGLRFWEHEIYNDLWAVVDEIEQTCEQRTEAA